MYFSAAELGMSAVRCGPGRVRAPAGCTRVSTSLPSTALAVCEGKFENLVTPHPETGTYTSPAQLDHLNLNPAVCHLLPPQGDDFSTTDAQAVLRRTAVFLPDHGCRLVASLAFVDPELGARPMYSCVRPECACAGVFFKDCGGTGCQLRLKLWIESATVPYDVKKASSVSVETADRLKAFFIERPPEVTLFYGRAACTETVSTPATRRWVPDDAALGGGSWEVTFRPSRITGEGILANLKATVGPNVIWTPGVELRTKPSEWIMVHNLPADATVASVTALMLRCTQQPAGRVVLRSSAVGGVAAFVQFASRAVAGGALLGWKGLVSGRVRDTTHKPLTPAERLASMSLLISLNRSYKDDTALRNVLVPRLELSEVMQQQQRPGYLPHPEVAATVSLKRAADVEDVVDDIASKRACVDAAVLPAFEDCESSDYDSDDDCDDDEHVECEHVPSAAAAVVLPVALPFAFAFPMPASPQCAKTLCDDVASPVSDCGVSPLPDLASLVSEDFPLFDDEYDFGGPAAASACDDTMLCGDIADFDSWVQSLCDM